MLHFVNSVISVTWLVEMCFHISRVVTIRDIRHAVSMLDFMHNTMSSYP